MPNRRTFLMTTLGALAACSVFQITSRLGKKTATVRNSAPAAPDQTLSSTQPAAAAESAMENSVMKQATLISRAAWGANAPLVTQDGRGENGPYDALTNPSGWMVYDQALETVLNRVIIHHSALPLTDGPVEIQRLHTEEKGFADIGYHFVINEKGELFEGRSLQVRGAHTYAANYGSVGICMLGNFEEIQPTANQLAVLNLLLSDLTMRFPQIRHLTGHLDHNPGVTLCPGANLYPLLPGIAREHNLQYGL